MTMRKDVGWFRRYSAGELGLMGLEFGTSAAAAGGGMLLALRPDGAFLHADPSVLRRTPFRNWRLPGLLLAAGCGGGYLAAGLLHLRRHRLARLVSFAAGVSLIGLEAWEIVVVEYQPLEVMFAAVGAAVVVLALRLPPGTFAAAFPAAAPAPHFWRGQPRHRADVTN
ncbi:hypothetical protein [Arthrobacter zhaoxinii]|uniref:hypothetical protein n=1 Tax=Arthrobacter zhaoxinii TaxID=2964616 RepID=UPI0021080286|nr:hypothetical protein [Arthrobacter zhaoxinii]MCQ2001081.1 hypothetical protein [Arthrobacter zhaoxinii]